ncbi:hypothetical protein KC274_14895, partial [Listeria monocytogenes]|uniref:hypothetical protein n=1 Tax=Listeria monocytogenes TaxID=1639 RepID=UPI001F57563B
FMTHEWFTRGWTLQELIAPINMEFFTDELVGDCRTSNWVHLATKASICEQLSAITKISVTILSHERQVTQASVAQRMSWAAK